ncbi:Uncharacterised protein [Mycobacteroides abscessus subsp. abscessus]|nr:Uncharacterised protein [Mycobacteroides abscessus subsp. abscessus]
MSVPMLSLTEIIFWAAVRTDTVDPVGSLSIELPSALPRSVTVSWSSHLSVPALIAVPAANST